MNKGGLHDQSTLSFFRERGGGGLGGSTYKVRCWMGSMNAHGEGPFRKPRLLLSRGDDGSGAGGDDDDDDDVVISCAPLMT